MKNKKSADANTKPFSFPKIATLPTFRHALSSRGWKIAVKETQEKQRANAMRLGNGLAACRRNVPALVPATGDTRFY